MTGTRRNLNPDRPVFYKGCVITRSQAHIALPTRGGSALYDITGRVTKEHGLRPFITSVAAAKRYITQEIDTRHLLRRIAP